MNAGEREAFLDGMRALAGSIDESERLLKEAGRHIQQEARMEMTTHLSAAGARARWILNAALLEQRTEARRLTATA